METLENTSVATLKAELVNDILFEKKSRGYRSIPEYSYDLLFKASVKVGNVVKDVTLRYEKEYSDGKYEYTHTLNSNNFADLKSAGIEIDFSDVMESYKIAVANNLELQAKEKKEKAAKDKIQRGIDWDNSWMHSLKREVENDKKLKIKSFTLTPASKTKVMDDNERQTLTLKYQNINVRIYFDTYEKKYTFENGYERTPTKEYPTSVKTLYITDSKVRRGKNGLTLIRKAFDQIDEYTAIRVNTKKRLSSESATREKDVAELSKLTGLTVTAEEVYKHREYGPRHDRGYYVWQYRLKVGEKVMSISFNNETKWNEETRKHEITKKLYSLGSFGKLNKKQIVGIINLLNA